MKKKIAEGVKRVSKEVIGESRIGVVCQTISKHGGWLMK